MGQSPPRRIPVAINQQYSRVGTADIIASLRKFNLWYHNRVVQGLQQLFHLFLACILLWGRHYDRLGNDP